MKIDLLTMSNISALFGFDLWCLHHNVHGNAFSENHPLFGSYYSRQFDDRDFFVEHALIVEEVDTAPNLNAILSNPNDIDFWEPVEGNTPFSEEEAYEELIRVGEDYIEALDECRSHCDKKGYNDITSDIDAMRGFWAVEVLYKQKQSLELYDYEVKKKK